VNLERIHRKHPCADESGRGIQMSRPYEWNPGDEEHLPDLAWSAWSDEAPFPDNSGTRWEALQSAYRVVEARGVRMIDEVRDRLRTLNTAWDDILRELVTSGNLTRWWPLAERILSRRRLCLRRLMVLRYYCRVELDEPFRPVAMVPVVVALRHSSDFANRDVLDAALERKRGLTRAELDSNEDELEAVASMLKANSVYEAEEGENGSVPRLKALLMRKSLLSNRLALLDKAAGGPEAAVAEMVAAVIDDAGGVKALASFLHWSDQNPDKPKRDRLKRRVEELEGQIREIDMQLDRLSRLSTIEQPEGATLPPTRPRAQNLGAADEVLRTVLAQVAARRRMYRELADARREESLAGSGAQCDRAILTLLNRALEGDETARADVERLAAAIAYPGSPQFVWAIGQAKWDSVLASVTRLGASVPHENPDELSDRAAEERDEHAAEPAARDDLDYDEFSLPCNLAQIPSHDDVTPWIGRMLGRNADDIRKILNEDWAQIRHPVLAHLRDTILTFRPVGLARREGRWYLKMRRTNEEYDDTICLESPANPDAVKRVLDSYGFAEVDLIQEFYRHFYGLTNDVGYPSSRFARPGEFTTIEEFGWDEIIEEYDPRREWAKAPIVYSTDTGDHVMLKSDGESAWGLQAENRITPFAPSFGVLLEQFIEMSRFYWALDYYRWVEKWPAEG
jgi:hypothetical protein